MRKLIKILLKPRHAEYNYIAFVPGIATKMKTGLFLVMRRNFAVQSKASSILLSLAEEVVEQLHEYYQLNSIY